MRKIVISLFVICCLLFTVYDHALANFNQEYIISDHDLTDASRMTLEEIQAFLSQFSGALKNYQTKDIDGQVRSAAEIIFNASQRYQINPQILITLIQKEQALVTKKAEKPSQYDWAAGFGASDNRKPIEKFRGFARQLDRAAWWLRYFLEHSWEFVFRPGQIYIISGKLVTPQNLATAALYNYTPYLFGNKLFWQIWQKWFAKTSGPFKEGSLVRATGDQGVWLIQNNERRPIRSKNVFLARFNFDKVREVPLKELEKYPVGQPVEFSNYSLLQAPNNGIYLLVDGVKRPIVSERIFREIGFNFQEVIKVDWADLVVYKDGPPVTTLYPTGALLRDKSTGIVYWVKDDVKQPVLTQEILEINFPYARIISVESAKLESFTLAEPIKFRDGTLIKTSSAPTVYFIADGRRHPIPDPETFETLGYRWGEIVTVPESILEIHSLGQPITILNNGR